jgi:hypothetical protein
MTLGAGGRHRDVLRAPCGVLPGVAPPRHSLLLVRDFFLLFVVLVVLVWSVLVSFCFV